MALEAVVYPQDPFSYGYKDCYSFPIGGAWDYDFELQDEEKVFLGIPAEHSNNNKEQRHGLRANWDSSSPSMMQHAKDQWDPNSSPETCTVDQSLPPPTAGVFHPMVPPPTAGRRKRRRTKSTKNKEEIENQRMTHIAVERNRRKQMNEYLAVLREKTQTALEDGGRFASLKAQCSPPQCPTVDELVLYSVSVKVEEGCHLNTVDEMQLLLIKCYGIHEEDAALS
ncbi:hypothetical protein GH714_002936 [Hevea brasiliensis]|uniref:BHLH domain-containing protein n=1 Tax=Hevea brasiliensis TaxID=3981 RepID=A0A6A6LFE4_HEVBR|nr:hypothetical protein GH714_002936 [Hevea brasiliensis]